MPLPNTPLHQLEANMSKTKELAVVEQEAQVVMAPSADVLEQSVLQYQNMKNTLDRLMPDQIVQTGSNADGSPKLFRRKGYWKAIAQGFTLTVEMVQEDRQEYGDDFGYCVTYKATDPRTGRSADGDGACFASEKAQRRGGIGGTEHNVRAHAHTRATNRAISNLVAFGEVSAEELEQGQPQGKRSAPRQKAAKPKPTLESHDGDEYIQEVNAVKQLASGATIHKIQSTRRVYTCIDDDVASMSQTAVERNCPVEIDWEEKLTKARNGNKGKPYNAINGVTLLQEAPTMDVEVVEPEVVAPDVDQTPDEDTIPF